MAANPKTAEAPKTQPTAAKPLAAEDICVGDYVAVLDEQHEYPAIVWYFDRPLAGEDEVVRLRLRPNEPQAPLLVKEVCLPFVFVKSAIGDRQTLDIRAARLARIDAGVARRVWKALKPKSGRGKRNRKNKKR